jgi:hypothetical protein
MPLKTCQQRAALSETYRAATNAYAIIVKELRKADTDYEFLYKRVERAREKMVAARENLNLHLATHHCQVVLD